MRFRLIDAAKEEFPLPEPVQGPRGEPKRLLRRAEPPRVSAPARRPGAACPCPLGRPALERDLRQPAHDARTAGHRPRRRPPSDGPADARERAQSPAEASLQAHPDSLHAFPVAPNLLDQDFTARRPDEKWGADLSYIWTREGWLYRAVVMDLYARRVVGWAVSDRLHKELALAALRRALGDDQGLVCFIHSDSQSAPASSSWAA
jgi:putative transposase